MLGFLAQFDTPGEPVQPAASKGVPGRRFDCASLFCLGRRWQAAVLGLYAAWIVVGFSLWLFMGVSESRQFLDEESSPSQVKWAEAAEFAAKVKTKIADLATAPDPVTPHVAVFSALLVSLPIGSSAFYRQATLSLRGPPGT